MLFGNSRNWWSSLAQAMSRDNKGLWVISLCWCVCCISPESGESPDNLFSFNTGKYSYFYLYYHRVGQLEMHLDMFDTYFDYIGGMAAVWSQLISSSVFSLLSVQLHKPPLKGRSWILLYLKHTVAVGLISNAALSKYHCIQSSFTAPYFSIKIVQAKQTCGRSQELPLKSTSNNRMPSGWPSVWHFCCFLWVEMACWWERSEGNDQTLWSWQEGYCNSSIHLLQLWWAEGHLRSHSASILEMDGMGRVFLSAKNLRLQV